MVSAKMLLLFLLLVFLPEASSKNWEGKHRTTTAKYSLNYFKPGNHVFGGILSLSVGLLPWKSFNAQPQHFSNFDYM